jgi:hypothetical protein
MSHSVPKIKPVVSRVRYFDENAGAPERFGKVIGDAIAAVLVLTVIGVITLSMLSR